jgi:hypothetical protein
MVPAMDMAEALQSATTNSRQLPGLHQPVLNLTMSAFDEKLVVYGPLLRSGGRRFRARSQFCRSEPDCDTNSQEFSFASVISHSGSWRICVERNPVPVQIADMAKRMHMSPLSGEPKTKRSETPWVSIAVIVVYCALLGLQVLP